MKVKYVGTIKGITYLKSGKQLDTIPNQIYDVSESDWEGIKNCPNWEKTTESNKKESKIKGVKK